MASRHIHRLPPCSLALPLLRRPSLISSSPLPSLYQQPRPRFVCRPPPSPLFLFPTSLPPLPSSSAFPLCIAPGSLPLPLLSLCLLPLFPVPNGEQGPVPISSPLESLPSLSPTTIRHLVILHFPFQKHPHASVSRQMICHFSASATPPPSYASTTIWSP